MAQVLALLMSGRSKGFTASVLRAAAEGAGSVEGVEVEWVHMHRHRFGPCRSCFNCIRSDPHECVQSDAMGAGGELMAKVRGANGWIVGDPVHMWGASAQCHLFIERCYPFVWSGKLSGTPFMSISCASNQGMHRLANENLCKWAFCYGMRHIGGLPVHTTHVERARVEAEEMGRELGRAAEQDALARKPLDDRERYVAYLDKPWSALRPYLENLTNGAMDYQSSLIAEALGSFGRPEALELLDQAKGHLEAALRLYHDGDEPSACDELVQAGALWTHATWKEFLEEQVVGAGVPGAYRPIDKDG